MNNKGLLIMKKAILFLLLLATMPMQTTAQVNPQKGYVITNGNDTVHGTIDYLTDARNAKACLFQKRGEEGLSRSRRPTSRDTAWPTTASITSAGCSTAP